MVPLESKEGLESGSVTPKSRSSFYLHQVT